MRNEDKSINRQFDFSKFTKINENSINRIVYSLFNLSVIEINTIELIASRKGS